jgi:hypothetical protein
MNTWCNDAITSRFKEHAMTVSFARLGLALTMVAVVASGEIG